MPKYLLVRHKETWQFSRNLSNEENIKVLLTKMAIFRHGVWDENLELFTQALLPLPDMRALQVAIALLAESPRGEGQTTLPSLGDIMAEYEACREVWPDFANGFEKVDTDPIFDDEELIIPEPAPRKALKGK